ncbi:hypothetical protein [Paenibacillus chitinolyticus]
MTNYRYKISLKSDKWIVTGAMGGTVAAFGSKAALAAVAGPTEENFQSYKKGDKTYEQRTF